MTVTFAIALATASTEKVHTSLGVTMKKLWIMFLSLAVSSSLLCAAGVKSKGNQESENSEFALTLTDAFFKNAPILTGGISENGKHVFLGYSQSSPVDTSLPVMELFENQNGTLVSEATLPLDSFITSGGEVNNVAVSRDFELFADFDDDGGTTGRIRLFSQSGTGFSLINEIFFNDVDVALQEALIFTDDNKFIVLSYATTATTPSQTITTLKLLRISDFTVVSSVTVTGDSNGPQAFKLSSSQKNFVLFGFSGYSSSNGQFTAPATLQVYKIKHEQLVLVDEASLPQFPNAYNVFDPSNCCLKETRIIVGTRLALLPNQKSVFQNIANDQTFLPGDNNNIREYSFDGESLHLIAKEQTDTGCFVSNFFRDGKTFSYSKGTSATRPFTASFFTTKGDSKHGQLEPVDGTITTAPDDLFFKFSRNGKWAIVGGFNTVSGFNNVNLYKTTTNLKTFKCPEECSTQ